MSYIILTALLSVLAFIGTTRAQFFCFVCKSPLELECNDVYNTTIGRSYDCSTLNYGTRSSEDDGRPPLFEILKAERITANTTFGCVKVHVTYPNNTAGIIRTCHPNVAGVEDQCEFISREQNEFRVRECNYCDTERCNSASTFGIPGFLAAVVLLACFQN